MLIGELRPRGRLQNIAYIDNTLAISTEPSDIDVLIIERELLSNNVENEPVSKVEKVMSMTEISNKVYKPLTYEAAISNPIHSRC